MSTGTQISRTRRNKSRKTHHVERDLISNLPDCVISHILSCLPMVDAVRTSILSKTWEYKWTSRHEIFLHDGWLYNGNKIKKANFAYYVDRILLLSPNLQSISLHCSGGYDFRRWISAALNRNVRCLNIKSARAESFILPRNLLSCYSLRELHLHVPCTFKVPTKACFHNLTSLELNSVHILNEHSNSDRVEFRFPLLEKLDIVLCQWINIKFVNIYAPKMTHLSLWDTFDGSNDCSLKITGDSLVKFSCYEESSDQTNVVLSGSAVVHANLLGCFGGDDPLLLEKSGLQFRKLLNGLANLKELELRGLAAKASDRAKRGLSLPSYYKMERLVLRSFYSTEGLLELLRAMPYLKLLEVDVIDLEEYDYDAMERVPSCIVSHLKKVTVFSYIEFELVIKLVKFFLKNAVQLKSLRVHPADSSLKSPMPQKELYAIVDELRTYPKASACLTISVEGAWHEKLNLDDVLS